MHARLLAIGLLPLLLAGCATLPGQPVAPEAAAKPAAVSPVTTAVDQEEAELHTQLDPAGIAIMRSGNQLVLELPAATFFDDAKAVVKPGAGAALASLGVVLKHFPKTSVHVFGYTDASGSDQVNKDLSQRRAVAVATALANQGVDQQRFYIQGRGGADPIASNATDAGRAQNRRVEIQLSPTP
jgi:outer membrane protein OmpA-like peptidoglycan-associated protein